ncbi:leucine-rich repeats and immunoglobulin-like domains protein 3 precursor [Danio rerio]|uniref:leucine-rich repeats and immunoglobulin-like domains protein 3 precursor n=1 Tax=Danio rerio TaxID=7955 RepID=UPI00015E445C|nr:leucine-rich repeats and immunoglobulin-like domains protein 3 precursor [Danio rerio]ABW34716.1 leucine-rich repeats and immunoglobulin-like domains 3 [Danio rerio]|eukprot:NP_001103817.1 leucine-rich repeats and immunoglobulin-like domains protein 3 precursor [Danio rerio]
MPQPARAVSSVLLLLLLSGFTAVTGDSRRTEHEPCPSVCSCTGNLADCSRLKAGRTVERLPARITRLDLSHNKLRVFPEALFSSLPQLSEIKLSNNEFESIPDLGPNAGNLSSLILASNRIGRVSSERLSPLLTLETLDLSNNNIVDVYAGAFPPIPLKNLFMNNNRISTLEHGCFSNLSSSLLVLKLNKNRLNSIPAKIFSLPHLQHLELSRNRLRRVEGLTFQGLHGLRSLKMQRNGISRLMDGAFWGLNNMEVLQLEFNNLTEVSKGWLYGLLTLQQLHLSHNSISRIKPDAWEFCQKLAELDLSWNQLSRLEEGSFVGLSVLEQLHIGNNRISFIADGAFRGLTNLQTLDLKFNEISWTIEDMNGPFSALDNLRKLFLQGNRIRSVTRKSFTGLEMLEQLDLSNNAIMSLQANAFSQMKKLSELHLNTSSLLCDCQLKWFSLWVAEQAFLALLNASCAHPHLLKGRSVFSIAQDEFVCDDFPKPQITVQPETQSAIKGNNVTFVCSAASSSDSPMTFAWKKDNELLSEPEIQNQAHVRAAAGETGELTEYTTTLQLRQVEFTSEGRYQCVISNHFGSSYSNKAKLTVNMLPFFTKTPMDLTIRAGATARLECAASGHPSPQIAWQKDGGTDFPAARERRMHVMPRDDVFFIVDVKTEDIGVYSCTAQNTAGAISANATLTVLETPSFLRPLLDRAVAKGETAVLQCIAGGSPPPRLNWTKDDSPLQATERHFFAAGNQLLIIVDAAEGDAGTYTCEMSNPLGTERGNLRLSVLPNPNCDQGPAGGGAVGAAGSGRGPEDDGWTTVGIVIIAVVCCVVGTSLVWVVIIYHTRRRNEDCSVTNTDETNLPADIPSYLSSQGTLAERQDGYMLPSESGSSHQFISSSIGGFYMPPKDMNSLCQLDTGSEADLEAAIDPLLCHYQGPVGSLLTPGAHYSAELPDTYTVCVSEPRLLSDSYSRKRDFYTCSSSLDPCDHMMLPHDIPSCVDDCETDQCVLPRSGSYMGTFGKAAWRPTQDHSAVILHENPYAALHAEEELTHTPSHTHSSVYEQPFDSRTIDSNPTTPLGS